MGFGVFSRLRKAETFEERDGINKDMRGAQLLFCSESENERMSCVEIRSLYKCIGLQVVRI